jgi:DNA-binding NtrC family response regulator
MPQITVRGPSGPPLSYHFDQDLVSVGRAPACDLVVCDAAVSRLHLAIQREGEGWVVIDRGSRNGTFLGGRPVDAPAPLAPGDEIVLGETTLVFETPVEDAIQGGADLPTTPLVWSSRGTGAGEEEPRLVGESEAIREVLDTIARVAPTDATVLITGENGTGKELAARLVHGGSPRRGGPFVVVNCPALPGTLLEAELFGVEKGVATGVEARTGRLELAQGGTLLLDEVGDMDPAAQAKILRFLEEKAVERVGGRERIELDVRVLASTNHDLNADIEKGAFRRDLYHRLNTVTIHLPSLRDRRDDIPLLVDHFVAAFPGAARTLEAAALDLLAEYDFPGNVRELEHIVERALILARGEVIGPDDLPDEVRTTGGNESAAETAPLHAADALLVRILEGGESFWDVVQKPYLRREVSRETARRLVASAYEQAGGSYKEMARLLGVADEYRRLLNFLHFHDLRVRK